MLHKTTNEIERKFLIKGHFEQHVTSSNRIAQGYLSSVPERTVRVRIMGSKAFLTIKGIGNESGMSRFEWEKEIEICDAEQLLQLCEPSIIDKTRNYIPCGQRQFEVDVFHGQNDGLIMAEIELGSENETFDRPHWLGEEVTGDARYYNSYLSKHPYNRW